MSLLFAFVSLPFQSVTGIYAVLFLVLVFSGIGLPVPEEVTLLFGGYLAYLEAIDFTTAIYVLIGGIVAADGMGYLLGRFAWRWVWDKTLYRWQFANTMLTKAGSYFERHGEKVVIFSRPFLGIRVAVPLLAGHFRMHFITFMLLDIAAAIPWTVFLVSLSYYLGSGVDLVTDIREIKHLFFALLGVAIIGYAALRLMKKNGHHMRV